MSTKKRLYLDLSKTLNPAKYRRTSSSVLNSDFGSLHYSTSSSISSELILDSNSIKGSPTPSMTDNSSCDDFTSVKSSYDSTKTCCESHSSISVISLSSDDGEKQPQTSQYSTSPSNESLNSNKRITRNTSRIMENTSVLLNQSSSTSSLTSHNEETFDPNRKRCLWARCKFSIEAHSNEELIEHVKNKHILSQSQNKKYHCLWKNCGVYNKPSCSFNWLERHCIDHIDTRPYSCLFTGCNRKFRTQGELVKHCDLHCNTSSSSSNSNNLMGQLNGINDTSPTKTRQQTHNILNTTKFALLHNIKHKNKSSSQLNELNGNMEARFDDKKKLNGKSKSSSNLLNGNHINGSSQNSTRFQNHTQILKALTKKRKTTEFNKKKFKKAQFKDFFDVCSLRVIDDRLDQLNFKTGTCTFYANIIGSCRNVSTGIESFQVEWLPKNYLENEWIESDKLTLTKTLDVNELKNCKLNHDSNPLYAKHRFRTNKRK